MIQSRTIRLTRNQVRQIDRLAGERYHIPGIVLMENAARAANDVAWEMLGSQNAANVLILCGGGNNGGDGFAVARHLHNRGVHISIVLTTDPEKYQGDAKLNWDIVQAMKLTTFPWDDGVIERVKPALVVDAIFGTGLTQAPRDPFARIVKIINESAVPVLAIDLPSGLDCDTGKSFGECVRATRTITFVAEKVGFENINARLFLGRVTVGDIGCPKELVDAVWKFEVT